MRSTRTSGCAGARARAATATASTTSVANTPASGRVVTGQLVKDTSRDLIDHRGDVARLAIVVDATGDIRAFVHTRISSVAGVDDSLERSFVPSGNKVTVTREARSVAVGENEWLC